MHGQDPAVTIRQPETEGSAHRLGAERQGGFRLRRGRVHRGGVRPDNAHAWTVFGTGRPGHRHQRRRLHHRSVLTVDVSDFALISFSTMNEPATATSSVGNMSPMLRSKRMVEDAGIPSSPLQTITVTGIS